MGRSRNRGRSEVENLKGRIRKLESELKYFKKREHFFDNHSGDIEEPQDIKLNQCKVCRHGIVVEYDFHHGVLKKCETCEHQEFKKRKNT